MSKLAKQFVGCTFDIETDRYKISYKITDESFDHSFGTEHKYSYEVASVKIYVEEVDSYIELGDDLGKLDPIINKLVEKDL